MSNRFSGRVQRLVVIPFVFGATQNVSAATPEEIPQVVVTASFIEQKLEDAPASITVIT